MGVDGEEVKYATQLARQSLLKIGIFVGNPLRPSSRRNASISSQRSPRLRRVWPTLRRSRATSSWQTKN